jgi:hypothetical protein
MNRRNSVFAVAVVICVIAGAAAAAAKPMLNVPQLFQSRPKPPQPSLVFAYRGWRVDASRTARVQPPLRTVRAIKAQIDIVEHLGLRPDILAFMRSQPIVGDGAPVLSGEPVNYTSGHSLILHVRRLDAKKPILLYGLLKAYMDQRLPGGFNSVDVANLRRQAAARRVWPNTALMLQGNDEFFALNAAAYLYGAITREPYTREDLKKTDPTSYQWLARLFDGGRARP